MGVRHGQLVGLSTKGYPLPGCSIGEKCKLQPQLDFVVKIDRMKLKHFGLISKREGDNLEKIIVQGIKKKQQQQQNYKKTATSEAVIN